MPVAITLQTIPIGSQFTSDIETDDPVSKNDFRVLVVGDGNMTGLALDDFTLTARHDDMGMGDISNVSLVSLEGENSVWELTIRPPVPDDMGANTSAILTLTLAADAITEGNAETSQEIRVSQEFPDDDAETPTALFTHGLSNVQGMTVTPNRIVIYDADVKFFQHDGTSEPTETISPPSLSIRSGTPLDFINGDYLLQQSSDVIRVRGSDFSLIRGYNFDALQTNDISRIVHTRLGVLRSNSPSSFYQLQPYDSAETDAPTTGLGDLSNTTNRLAHQDGLLYYLGNTFPALDEITPEGEIHTIAHVNLNEPTGGGLRDLAIYRDTLYWLTTDSIYTLDIRKYRPLAKNTKTTIYPIFATNGDTIPLKQFCPDGKDFTFSVGFDKPDYLSINSSDEIAIANNAVSETTPVFMQLTGINYIDSADFSFYLVIIPAENPTVRDVDELTMRADSSYDLFQIVENATGITFRSGRTQPTGSSISNGVFTIGTADGTAEFTATNANGNTHFQIGIDVIQAPDRSQFSDDFDYRIEIGGVEIPINDVLVYPSVSVSLDAIQLNAYRANEVSLTLKSDSTNDFYYNDGIADNFWSENSLNSAGFRESIKIYVDSVVGADTFSHLLFSGTILDNVADINETSVELTCIDASLELRNTPVEAFGNLRKWDALRQQSDEDDFAGVYVPEGSLLPIQLRSGQAWKADGTQLTLRELALPSEGAPIADTAYLTTGTLQTSGGFLDDNPALKFLTNPLSEDVKFLFAQLGLNQDIHNVEVDVPAVTVDTPYILNRGSVPFSVEDTRITRLPTDWVYDSTNDRLLILLSNPEWHIADLLVQYDLESDTYRVLHTFDKDISTHRITRRTSTDYYILSAKAITQDRSASALPRAIDGTGYAYDSASEESDIKILRYNASTNTLTEHVAEDDTRPPQLGIHYHIGFENDIYIDEFEGIRPDDRGAFKFQGSNLYYRYATPSEFGVARVNTSGTTTEMISEADLAFHNHLNFAFDITPGGDIYFVYATGDAEFSTLTIKRRTSGGTESTLFSETRAIGDFNDIGLDWGAFLGAYEALFYNSNLYILAPIQKADFGDDFQSVINPDVDIEQLTAEKSGERNVTTSTNLNPSNLTLSPGDDIPLRIDFDGTVTGATQDDLTVYGGTIESFSISSDMIDVTIRPDDPTVHKTIILDLAEDAVDQTNEAWRITIDFETTRSQEKTSGMALYKCNVTDSSPSLTVIETWDFATRGGCNLTVHNSAVHFMESPPALTHYKPINPDLDGYWTNEDEDETLGYNQLPDPLGALKRVETDGSITELGNLWFEDRAYNVALTRPLSVDGDLHITMGYSDADAVLRYNALASKNDNFAHLVVTDKLHYVVPTFDPTGNRYELFADLAQKVNATFSFENGLVSIQDRSPITALTDGATGTGTGNLDFDGENKTPPTSGYVRIGDEIIGYTGISSGALTGVTRGALATTATDHANGTKMLFLDDILETQRITDGNFTIASDTTRVYNVIESDDDATRVEDDSSIAEYGRLPYTLSLGLTHHENAWRSAAFANYLENLKDLQSVVSLRVQPSFWLRLGQRVSFTYEGLVYSLQIISLVYEKEFTQIQVRTVG